MNIVDWDLIDSVYNGRFPESALDGVDDMESEDDNFRYQITLKNKKEASRDIDRQMRKMERKQWRAGEAVIRNVDAVYMTLYWTEDSGAIKIATHQRLLALQILHCRKFAEDDTGLIKCRLVASFKLENRYSVQAQVESLLSFLVTRTPK
jgi:hypothetical protein